MSKQLLIIYYRLVLLTTYSVRHAFASRESAARERTSNRIHVCAGRLCQQHISTKLDHIT